MNTLARKATSSALLALLAAALGSGCGEGGSKPAAEELAAGAPLELPPFDPETVPERLALLVGIDRYAPGSGLGELDGSVNDVRAVREMLVGRFQFPRQDVLLLENEQATHERIVRSFEEWLLGRAGSETEVVFWFSGHGSRVPDADGEETDEWDETLLAWDSRADGRAGSYDLVDDELSALLAALGQRTSRTTVVTDCCHSGSVVRGAPSAASSPKVRFATNGTEPFDGASIASFWPAKIPLTGDEQRGASSSYVHIAACGPAQYAHEMRDTAHGALTFYLLQALENAQPDHSYQLLADEASVHVSSSFPRQTVWYEGQIERKLFSGGFAPQPPGLAASLQSAEVLKLRAGPWSGLCIGSRLGVHDALSFERVGEAVVEAVSFKGARARFVPAEGVQLRAGGSLRAVEESRPAGLDPLPVFVAEEALATRLGEQQVCEVAPEPGPGRYEVTLEDGRYALRTPEKLRIWLEGAVPADGRERVAAAAQALAVTFRQELRYRALQLLAQVPNAIPIAATFVSATEADREGYGGEPWIDAGLRPVTDGRGRAAGGEFEAVGNDFETADERRVVILRVSNPGAEPVYATVISVAEDRSINRIWPPNGGGADRALIPAGGVLRAPVGVAFDPSWDLDRPMRDRYLVLATPDYPGISFRNQGSQMRSGSRWSAVAELALAGERTRGSGSTQPVPLDPEKLGIRVIDLLVTGEH